MDSKEYMILINGWDKTDSVVSFCFQDGMCTVVYSGASKSYCYRAEKVQILKIQSRIDPSEFIITVGGNSLAQVDEILDFGLFYRFLRTGKKALTYPKGQVEFQKNCLANPKQAHIFEYFKETATAVSLVAEGGFNILRAQYEWIKNVSDATVLSCYLDSSKKPTVRALPETVIYPFGFNQSQKTAIENALSSQISIIQGPPGTGKTQTILNIIANAVRNGQTVAVVSNNNSATLNVVEKLEKKGLSFLTAFLGNRANKERFWETQTGRYPDMSAWVLEREEKLQLNQEVTVLSKELSEMFDMKNRIAAIEQELIQLTPEKHYFGEYYSTYAQTSRCEVKGLSSQKILSLWLEYEQYIQRERRLGLLQKISILFRFNLSALKVFLQTPELVIPYLQRQFYVVRRQELTEERDQLEKKLEQYAFNKKMEELAEKSLRLFRAELSEKFHWKKPRQRFEIEDFRERSRKFNREYPVILSTTYSIKGTLNFNHTYDYLIVDEASQVDLATGVLAFASAKNIVIVGDLRQLPNVLDSKNIQKSEEIWKRYSLAQIYHFSAHSLLSSAIATWPEAPTVLLREHYRCHPKIINFCNQKFYGGKLIVMTEDHGESDVLTMYRTAPGNHARGHLNQRQIDVIRQEVLPSLERQGYRSIGIITPYRDQVTAIQTQLGKESPEVATVHKFQGREKDAIILTSVDNVITEFVDDPRMLNVAVSRAVKSLTVVTSQDLRNDQSNYGDLARYIEYNNCAVIESTVYSVFDLLYQGYAEQRRDFLKKHRRISEYDSENLLYAIIQEILQKAEFSSVGCVAHVSLVNLIKDYSEMTAEETVYARNPLTHVDFLLFRRMDKSPLLAIEVDGTTFHTAGSVQASRDEKKNRIFELCGIPLLRLRTDESGEKERVEQALLVTVSNS